MKEAEPALAEAPDCVLLELSLPDASGLESLRRVVDASPRPPVVVLTALSDDTVGLEAVRCGAQDFLVKDRVDPEALERAIRYAIERSAQQQRLDSSEGALRAAEDRFQSLVERVPTITYEAEFSPDAAMVYISPQVEQLLGYPAADWTDDPGFWQSAVHTEDLSRVMSAMTQQLEDGTNRACEYRLVAADGQTVWIRDEDRVIRNGDGRPVRTQGVMIDINDAKRTERRVLAQQWVSRTLAKAEDLDSALPAVLEALGQSLGFSAGACWTLDPGDHDLRLGPSWSSVDWPGGELPAGDGDLAGRAITELSAVTLENLDELRPSPLVLAARDRGCEAALGIPVTNGDHALGAIELYGYEPLGTDEPLLTVATAIGAEIGQFISRERAEDEVSYNALHDELTGLPNRVLFLDRGYRALARSRESGVSAALLFVDIDGFKRLNDTHGHQTGDALLRLVAPKLSSMIRATDTVARLGGDEFATIIEGMESERDALSMARQLQEKLKEPLHVGGQDHRLSVSIGVALSNGQDMDGLIRDADAGMHRARALGGGRAEMYDEGLQARAEERLTIERDLRLAVARDELRLVFQPILRLPDACTTGVEALVRWEHPERGLVAPDEFIPVAEETGLIVSIGAWVLEAACAQAARWRAELGAAAPVPINVNVAALQLHQPDFPEVVGQALDRAGLDASTLTLEITESALIDNPDEAAAVVRRLRALGVGVALDDFGTGYSSLAYLHRFPVDTIKIDRAFVSGAESGVNVPIVRAVVGMARALGMYVVAEGVETAEQARLVAELGCAEGQGYLFARPMSGEAISQRIGPSEVRTGTWLPVSAAEPGGIWIDLRNAIRNADRETAKAVLHGALRQGHRRAEIHDQIVMPAVRSIGALWKSGVLSVTDEHMATETCLQALSALDRPSPEPDRELVLLAAADTVDDRLILRSAQNVLEDAGHKVVLLGGNASAPCIGAAIRSERPGHVALFSTLPGNGESFAATIDEIRAVDPDMSIVVGGNGVPARVMARSDVLATDSLAALTTLTTTGARPATHVAERVSSRSKSLRTRQSPRPPRAGHRS